MKTIIKIIAAVVGMAAATTFHAQAAIIAYEGFSSGSYTAGQLLNQNPTITGFSGAWSGDNTVYAGNSAVALSYAGVASDNSGGVYKPTALGNGREARNFSTTLTGNNVYYISLMMKNSAVGGADYRAFELGSVASGLNDSERILQVGANGDNGDSGVNWGMRVNNNASLRGTTSVAAVAGNTVFAAIKLTFLSATNADSAQLWINPTNLSSEAGSTGSLTLSGFDFLANTAANLRFASFNNPANVSS